MKTLIILFLLIAAIISSCDPGLNGNLKVFNNTSVNLNVITYDRESSDTSTYLLHPNTSITIKVLSGLGNQKTFDCCPCELKGIVITSATGNIKKDPALKENWVIPNRDQQRKFGGEDLRCEFHVYQRDL